MDPVEIREVSTNEIGAVDHLVSGAFGYSKPDHYFQDFPVWESNEVLRLGAFQKGLLCSHAGVRFTRIKTSSGLVPIALIGAVATAAGFRGKGLSTSLLREALSRIDAHGIDWTLLWGSEHEFYAKLGFSPQGIQARALIADLSISPKELKSETPKSGIMGAIFLDLLNKHSGVGLTPTDRSWVFAQETVKWLYLENPFGYIAYGRGMDLKNIVHEWGGDPDSVRKLLFQIYQRNPNAEILGRPSDLLTLGFDPDHWLEEPLCLARSREPGLKWNPEFWISGIGAV